MKILLITLEYPPIVGGVSTYLSSLYEGLGHEVQVISPATMKFSRWWCWPRWLPAYFEIKKIVERDRPDEIHISHILPIGYIAYWLYKKFNIPYTIFFHGTDLLAGSAQPGKWKRVHKIVAAAKRVVVNSEATKKLYAELLPGGPAPHVITPGAPTVPHLDAQATEALRERYALYGQRVILFLARLVERKGVFVALRGMAALLKANVDATLVVVGDGPVREAAEKLATELQLYNRVRFIGSVSNEEKWAWYGLAHVFWFPAQRINQEFEGFGITSLEAQSFGCPVIASAIDGLPESLQHGVTGFAVAPTPEAFAEATEQLLNDAAVWQQFRQHAKQYAATRTWKASQEAFHAFLMQ